MVLKYLLALLFLLPLSVSASVDEACKAALKTLFSENVSKAEASNFLKVQGDITLHRLAWAYLKAQKSDETEKLENTERTILTLLDEKYTSTDPEFIKARDQFEAQPLSRTALAEIGPYLQEVLSQEFGPENQAFILNASDLKLLHALSKFEKEKANNGIFESRMLARKAPEGMLNFAKLINSSYKVSPSSTEAALEVELRLQGLEKTIGQLQKRVNDFIGALELPTQCKPADECEIIQVDDLFNQNKEIQDIFWESLSDKFGSDDLLLDNLTYGEFWLRTGPAVKEQAKINPKPAVIKVVDRGEDEDKEDDQKETIHQPRKSKSTPVVQSSNKIITKTRIAGKTTVSQPSRVKGYYSAGTGLYIDDPIGVILKDDPRRKADSWKTFDSKFLEKMADAILNDDKVFEMDGHLYSRKTGKRISVEAALKLLPPKKSAQTRAALKFQEYNPLVSPVSSIGANGFTMGTAGVAFDPKKLTTSKRILKPNEVAFNAKQIAAVLNGEKSFISGTKVYTVDGREVKSPALVISQVMSKKTGGKYTPERYKGFDQKYLVERANALQNNKPHFKIGSQVYDSETGRNLTSPFRSTASTQDVKIQKQKRVQYQNLSDKETIINFHRDHPKKDGCQHYAIVDKKNAEITVYNLGGEKVFSREVLIGVKASDAKTRWTEYNDVNHQGSYTTGAGAFTIGEPKKGEYYSKHFNNNILQIEGQNVFAVHQIPNGLGKRYQYFGTGDASDRRVSQGCVNMKQSDYLSLVKWMKPTCQIYVLPEEAQNKFVVKDGRLEMIATAPVKNKQDYNYAKQSVGFKPIKMRITDGEAKTTASVPFVKALEDEKEKLMKLFSLTNDDYNDLATVSFAIMGNESNFGKSKKYWIKEHDQGDVIIAKAAKRLWEGKNPFDRSVANTSRGYTQIKELPEGAWRKAYPEINKTTLGDPKNAAVSTIAYLAGAVRTLKNIAVENQKDPRKVKITKENLVDYLGYIYQGRKGALKDGNEPANADFNTYVQGLRRHMAQIEVSQKIE